MIRLINLILFTIFLISSSVAYSNASIVKNNVDQKFNNYVEGAMQVYVQFKQPSKSESEQFYAFVKSKWISSPCDKDCQLWGYNAGKEYATRKKVEIENKEKIK